VTSSVRRNHWVHEKGRGKERGGEDGEGMNIDTVDDIGECKEK
jgi:hypothetical protein